MPQRRRHAAPILTRPPHGWVSRADVTVNLAEIEAALKAGETKVSIWRALFSSGKVRCGYPAFARRLRNFLDPSAKNPPWTPQPRTPSTVTGPNAPSSRDGSETVRLRTFRPNPTPDIDSLI
jgi:hypothetical protein